jgi:cytochrome P450
MIGERPVPSVSFDHHSREFADDPWSVCRDLRRQCPVAHSDAYGGFWVLSRYEDIKRVALDNETYSSAGSIVIPPKLNRQRSIPIELDPPLFQEYRRVMQRHFAPAAVQLLEPHIERFADLCIDEFIERGACDLVHDLADPVPAMTTLHLLGLPVDDWRSFSEPLHATVFLRQDNPGRVGALEGLRRIRQILITTIAERRSRPGGDLISHLTQATIAGRPISDDDVLEMATLTIQGGFDTTGSLISNALLHLDRDREARARLIADPGLLATAIEEFLRFEAPQFALARTVTRDVVIGGQTIRADEKVLLVWASGNRDEAVFPDAETLVLDRFPNRHMTFGLGAHRCLGSTLARRMAHITLGAVLARLPDYSVDHARVVRADTIGVVYGKFSVPATFSPGPRRVEA